MAGQATIAIRNKQWQVYLATSPWELAQGLSGIPGTPPGTGMLFDLGFDTSVTVTTVPLLFPIDIAFISNSMVVVDIARNVPPGYLVTSGSPARYVLEVSTGELQGIYTGDRVSIYLLPLETGMPPFDWLSSVINIAALGIVMVLMVRMVKGFTKALQEPSPEYLPEVKPRLTQKWFDKGVEAGKTEGWMNVEETLPETLEVHRDLIKNSTDLVWTDIELWEQTDHFNILYGSKMWDDAERDIEFYSDLKSEFWDGYLAGRKQIGIDIYDKARGLLEETKLEFMPEVRKRGKVLYVVELPRPKYIQRIELYPGKAVLVEFEKPVVTFRPTESQRRKIEASSGRIFIFDWQILKESDLWFWTETKEGSTSEHQHFSGSPTTKLKTYKETAEEVALDYLARARGVIETDEIFREENPEMTIREYALDLIADHIEHATVTGQTEWKSDLRKIYRAVEKVRDKDLDLPAREFANQQSLSLRTLPRFYWKCIKCGKTVSDTYVTWYGAICPECKSPLTAEYKVEKPKRPRREGELEYLADSPEFLAQTIEAIGYRQKIDTAFQEAIRRAKGLS